MLQDLRDNVLRIGDQSVAFLGEAEIPKRLQNLGQEPVEVGSGAPGGGAGAGTGAEMSMEPKIQELVALGFDRAAAERALAATKGNVELAASMLFG